MGALIAPAINVALLIVGMFVFLRKPFRDYLSQRHTSLKSNLQDVRQELKRAQLALEEYSSKLHAVDAELAAIRDQVRQDAESLKSHIISEGHKNSERIVADARQASDQLVFDLKKQLRREMAEQVLQKAEVLLVTRLTGEDRERLRQEFSKQAETIG